VSGILGRVAADSQDVLLEKKQEYKNHHRQLTEGKKSWAQSEKVSISRSRVFLTRSSTCILEESGNAGVSLVIWKGFHVSGGLSAAKGEKLRKGNRIRKAMGGPSLPRAMLLGASHAHGLLGELADL